MLIGDWGFEGGTDGGTGVTAGSDHAPVASGAGDPIPLAQHPAAMLTGTKEGGSNPSNKPLGRFLIVVSSANGNDDFLSTCIFIHCNYEDVCLAQLVVHWCNIYS